MAKIVLTGGGTAGHVTANLALIPGLKERKHRLFYIGSEKGIEKELAEKAGLPYYGIATGKFRRYFSLQNFTDPFKVIAGFFQARKFLKKEKINLVFSKGGFVAVPVVYAAASLGIPVICHESDMTPGLANKLTIPFAKKICCNFPETLNYLPKKKAVFTGAPIREELLQGSREKGIERAGFSGEKEILLIIGGSMGSQAVNQVIRKHLDQLLKDWDILHVCGKGNADEDLKNRTGYQQYEYVHEELADYYQAADCVISRAGANVICELLALEKPNLLIPLPKGASRGDQILNAESFQKQGYSLVLSQEEAEADFSKLYALLKELKDNKAKFQEAMRNSKEKNGRENVLHLIDSFL